MTTPSNCVMCGAPIPKDQESRTCSMCYGDIDHGKDGYYRAHMEAWEQDAHRAEEAEAESHAAAMAESESESTPKR